MSTNSHIAFMEALTTGLLKSWDDKVYKYIELTGPKTWKEVQAGLENITGKRITDSNINSSTTRLNQDGKLIIIGSKLNPASNKMNSIYDIKR